MRKFALFFLVPLLAVYSAAQMPDVPPVGIPVGSTITADGMDTVVLSNLGIDFNVPIRAKRGRGIPFATNLSFDNQSYGTKPVIGGNVWTIVTGEHPLNGPIGTLHFAQFAETCVLLNSSPPGQRYSYTLYEVISYTDGEGTSHPFGTSGLPFINDSGAHSECKLGYSYPGASGIATDGSGISVYATVTSGVITYPNGTQIHPALVWSTGQVFGQSPNTITDSNGNWMSQSWAAAGYPEIGSFTDTLGTTPISVENSAAFPSTLSFTYLNSSGSDVPAISESFKAYTLQTAFGCPIGDVPAGAGNLLDTITLADGTSYKFTYEPTNSGSNNVTGRVASVTLPSGGVITYQYVGGDTGKGVFCVDSSTSGLRRTTPDGTWTYTRSNVVVSGTDSAGFIASNTTTVTDPLGNQTVINFYAGSGNELFEVQRQVYTGTASGTPIEATITCYNGETPAASCAAPVPPTPFTEVNVYRSLNGGPQSRVDTFYNAYSQVTEKDEYDFGATTPTRKTLTTYATTLGPNINDHFSTVKIEDGSGNLLAETDYTYDQDITSLKASGSTQLNAVTCSGTCRGNLTTLTKRVNSSSTIVETFTHYDNGLVYQATDAKNNVTTYTYGDCGNSLLTSIALPLSLTESYTWDCNGAVETQATDSNGQLTTYRSADPLWRITAVNYADGGQSTATYNDTASPPSEVKTQLITSSVSRSTQTNFDGYGRPVLTMLTTDPDGTDNTTTAYDGDGREAQVSNPYRNTGESTYGVTKTQYDGLGRVTTITRQDGSIVTTTYNQNCTTVTDETLKSRESCVDGLGRLTQVFEDPGSSPHLNYETDYAYDGLNNLLTVTQKGGSTSSANWRSRSFVYDSLSRLTSATNPESGKIAYAYDANSNLITKTAPSPNQPSTGSATVTTTYTYDALNRLTGKSYNDSYTSNPATPSVSYGYDGVLLSCPDPVGFAGKSATNGIGRRTAMCFSAGSKSWQYDPMGRISDQNDRFIGLVPPLYKYNIFTNSAGVQSTTTDTEYNYDLIGDLATVYYPGQGIPTGEFYTAENGAGRIITAGDETYHALTNGTYTPDGQLATAEVCNNTCNASNTYNSRLQPVLISTSTTSGTPILNLTYNFNPGTDNGNVIQIANGKDSNRTQNFIYDPLNRIWQAYTNGPNWGETYSPNTYAAGTVFSAANAGIDGSGNLAHRSGVTGKGLPTSTMDCPANTNNQLTTCGFGYDPAGNITSNGSISYVYDAENRLIAAGGDSYLYDGDGQRIEKCTEGTTPGTCASNATGTFYWLRVGGGTLAESDLGGNWTAAYGLIGGQIIDRVDLPANVVHYFFHDYLHSTNIVTGSAGNILNESDYSPYGVEIPITSGDSNRYKFTGKERDAESGLDDFGARYYASTMGRFLTPDPLAGHVSDPQTLNRYAYVRNNPLNLTDPTGLDFNLTCSGADTATCHGGLQGTTTTTTDANGNQTSTFAATVISNNSSGGLVDQNGNQYSAAVTGAGVSFTQAGSDQSSLGTFINGSNETNLQATNLPGFSFTFTYSNPAGNVTAGGAFTYSGTSQQAQSALEAAGFHHYSSDEYDILHPSSLTYHAIDFRSAGQPGTGAGSGHFTVHDPWGLANPFTALGPTPGDVHLGEHNNSTPGGFWPHTQEVINTFRDKLGLY